MAEEGSNLIKVLKLEIEKKRNFFEITQPSKVGVDWVCCSAVNRSLAMFAVVHQVAGTKSSLHVRKWGLLILLQKKNSVF